MTRDQKQASPTHSAILDKKNRKEGKNRRAAAVKETERNESKVYCFLYLTGVWMSRGVGELTELG